MKKEELTTEEIAKLSATDQKSQRLQKQMQETQQELQQAQDQQGEIMEDIKSRLDLSEEVQPEDFDFSEVNFDSFQGSVIIKEEEDEPERAPPQQNQGEE